MPECILCRAPFAPAGAEAKDGGSAPLLLKLNVDAVSQCAADLSFLSVFPHEHECILPPCTYLESKGDHDELVRLPNGEEQSFKIIEVVPHPVDE